jgi:tRNA nucleotidyltransferase (CCA-adding enzyme)
MGEAGGEPGNNLCYNADYQIADFVAKMTKTINLSSQIKEQLPAKLVKLMQAAGEIAAKQGQKLYLVGGAVRDLLLGQANFDLDLVVEGDAINLAQQLTRLKPGKITTHPQFGTAKLQWGKWSVDLATARSETYAKPGALPSVEPSSIDSDLFRRDFTINAMAIYLTPDHYGELIDLHGGRDDLEHGLIRILHKKSFADDATRIWRGLRYEQRLDFQLEKHTLKLLKQNIPMLDTISGDRIRYELECIFKEKSPEKILRQAGELGVLAKLHPSLKGDGWLAGRFKQARQLSSPDLPTVGLYLALLAYPLTNEENKQLISRLRLTKSEAQTLRDTNSLKDKLGSLADPELAPSRIYSLLHSYSAPAIIANESASDSLTTRRHLQLFLDKLRYVKPILTGNDLLKMGIAPGPYLKEVLQLLHEARLDGKVATRKDEEDLVKGWLDEAK